MAKKAQAVAEKFTEAERREINNVLTLLRPCEDSMGRDSIVYFPEVAWDKMYDEDEEVES